MSKALNSLPLDPILEGRTLRKLLAVLILLILISPIPLALGFTVTDNFTDENLVSGKDGTYVNTTAGWVELAFGQFPTGWFNTSFGCRMKITLEASWLSGNLANATIPLRIDNSFSTFWSGVQNDADDVRFVDADNTTRLYWELDEWTYASNHSVMWVRIPTITDSDTDFFWLYFANATVEPDPYQGEGNSWDDDYVLVMHMSESAGLPSDSSSSDNDADVASVTAYSRLGAVGDAIYFGNTVAADYVTIPDDVSLQFVGASDYYTIASWIYPNVSSFASRTIIEKYAAPGPPYRDWLFAFGDSGHTDYQTTYLTSGGGPAGYWSANTLPTSTWSYGTVLYDGNSVDFYKNGIVDGSYAESQGNVNSGQKVYIGKFGGGAANNFGGLIDEIRVSDVARSSDWIRAEYEFSNDESRKTYGTTEHYTGTYISTGTLHSTNLLVSIGATGVDSFSYECMIEGSETILLRFSRDNSTWYNSTHLGGWETLSTGSSEISLSVLGWEGGFFYYMINMTEGSTPELIMVQLEYVTSDEMKVETYWGGTILVLTFVILPLGLAIAMTRRK